MAKKRFLQKALLLGNNLNFVFCLLDEFPGVLILCADVSENSVPSAYVV